MVTTGQLLVFFFYLCVLKIRNSKLRKDYYVKFDENRPLGKLMNFIFL